MNKIFMYTSIIDISNFQTVSILGAKLWKAAMKYKNVFNFQDLFLKIYIFEVATFLFA